ncbi:MAG TPA: hypothetical protein VI819_05175 [Patescibacteria group bacterium]|nr:hypothetical protein [Patescibacteria group bacterium]
MPEKWFRRVENLAIIPVIGGDLPGMYREFPPELHDAFEEGKKALVPGEQSYISMRGPVKYGGFESKVFIVSKITLVKVAG